MNGRQVTAKHIAIISLLIVAFLFPLIVEDEYYLHTFIISGIYILLVLGLNLILGYTGLLSLGHAAFYGIGAYTSTLLVMELNLPFWAAFFISGFSAGLAGLLLGFPALRLKGAYLVICTLAFVEITHQIMMNWESLTRGPMGITGIPSPPGIDIGGWVIDFGDKCSYYYLILSVVSLAVISKVLLVNSKTGRALIAIREDSIAAEMMGIDLTYYKLLSFFCACFLAGIAGSLYAHYIGYVSPESFTLGESVNIVVMTLVGGMGTIVGSVLGAVGLTFMLEFMRALVDYRMVIYGVILTLIIVAFPDGAIGIFFKIKELLLRNSHQQD